MLYIIIACLFVIFFFFFKRRSGNRILVCDGFQGVSSPVLGGGGAQALCGLAHRLAHLVRLAGGDPDASLPVAHRDERVEAEAPAALHDLRDAVDGNHVLDEPVALALPLARVAPLPTAPPTPTAPTPATPPSSAASTP